MISLYNNDCLDEMKNIADKSIDLILCDLPYGTSACKDWDFVIPFAPLWEQYERIIKDKGAIVLFSQEPFSSKLRCSNMKLYKYDWVWLKENGTNFLNYKYVPAKITENICVFSKGGASGNSKNLMNYYPIMIEADGYKTKSGGGEMEKEV